MGPGSNVLIQGGEFVQHNHAPNVHNYYNADGWCYLASPPLKSLNSHIAF